MKSIINYIKMKYPEKTNIGIVLGSGLDAFCQKLDSPVNIPSHDIPNFREASVKGHKGEFSLGKLHNQNIVCANGRFHYYEGYPYEDVAIIIDVLKCLGCELIIITNASGCVVK